MSASVISLVSIVSYGFDKAFTFANFFYDEIN